MTTYLSAVPAYGRDYQTEEEVRTAWSEGKDFRIMNIGPLDGRYVNKGDKPADVQLNIRYNKQMEVCVIAAGDWSQVDPDTIGYLDADDS